MAFYVYVLASKKHGTLYTGMTDDLAKRIWMHKEKIFERSFTSKYGVDKLVWYEVHESRSAFARERAIKKWNRAWKMELIEKENPDDLYESLMH